MTDTQYTPSAISAAVHAGADLVQDELDLGERDQDLIHLIVNAATMHLDNPDVSFDDVVRATFDRPPAAVRGWWSSWA
ncbi:hypothetical protein [Actinophytocola xanthii]|uniref:Uncharacterized protein n=1 Tax=Actinophytocola xanthii TaxID=1912961 RepID=A0A1Q8CGI8_9PSEU|nr:hypothetical protein [Actinophytocola xanthii]OLF13489.1 hypothetical protein BU204_27220 [Actinophytocola xanthii]